MKLAFAAVAAAVAAAASSASEPGDAAPAPVPVIAAHPPETPRPDSVPGGDRVERVQVADAFVELRTFPGRGYPVFYVAGRGEWLSIELRHTDWFKVRTASGKEGWVARRQLESTLAEGGDRQAFRDVLLDDYLARRVELGAGYGRFHSEPMVKAWLSVRVSDTLSLEWTLAQVQGVFSGTSLWHVNLQAEPWSDQRLSPFAGVGIGHFGNVPNQSLVQNQQTSARLGDAMVGARWHLSDRFMLRADYAIYTAFVSDQRSLEYRAASLGLSFFF
jgi:SH3-like domain-containing protein